MTETRILNMHPAEKEKNRVTPVFSVSRDSD